jgi:apolipoprotein D and lipocalin family protein
VLHCGRWTGDVLRGLRRLGLILLALNGCATPRPVPALAVVPEVDLPRYMGVWYEIARFPNRFQEGCVDSQATYALRKDGRVEVVNECVREEGGGKRSRAVGRAKVVDPETNAKLKVSFFWPFYGDYWIVDLGASYEYAVVSEPKRRYLWILSRNRELPAEKLQGILAKLRAAGFDTEKLLVNPSSAG